MSLQKTKRRHNRFLVKHFYSSVGTATGYRLDGRSSIPRRGKIYVGQSKSSRNYLTPKDCCIWGSYRLDRVLLCKFCRGSGETSGRQGQWFLHHHNAPSHTSLVVSSPNHRTLRISPRVTFGSSVLENGPQGDTFRNYGGHQVECNGRTPEDSYRNLPPVLPTAAGSMQQVCVCACVSAHARKCHTLKVIM
jgi:hypothetical protein